MNDTGPANLPHSESTQSQVTPEIGTKTPAATTSAAPNRPAPSRPTPKPPIAAKHKLEREHHGRIFIDEYEWLRDKESAETIAYLEAENAYTEAITAPLEPLTTAIYEEIKSRVKETDMSVPVRSLGWWYYSRTVEGKSYALHCRVAVADKFRDDPSDIAGWNPPEIPEDDTPVVGEQLLFDGNIEAEGHTFFSLGAFSVSDDGSLLAYSVDVEGDERYTLRFRYIGKDDDSSSAARESDSRGDALEEIAGIAPGVTWSPCGTYVFYSTVDEAWRPDTVWRHRVGTSASQDEKVMYEADESYWIGVGITRSDKYLSIAMGSKITTEVWMLDSADPTGEFWCVRPREEGLEYDVEHAVIGGKDRFLIVHNRDAPNSLVAEAPAGPVLDLDALHILVEHDEHRRIEAVEAFASTLVLSYRAQALPRFALMDIRGGDYTTFRPVDFDDDLFTSGVGGNAEWEQPLLRIGFGSFIRPARVSDLVVETGEMILRREQEVVGGYDPDRYVQRRDWAIAADGTAVPLSVVMSVETAARVGAGEAVPTMLYGYGSYESSTDPAFSVARLSILQRGMAFVVAHVRGGGELGRLWYEEGKELNKLNTFTDFIACADHLIGTGFTAPDRLVADGGSAGGLLMGAVANLAPDRFVGIEASVPFVDPLTSILMPELPLTVIEWDEWGNPLEDAEVYDYMASYSPYENVEAKDYPSILAITSLNDTRVLYVEPAKWIAKLRATATSANDPSRPILLKTEMTAGHGGVSGRYEKWRETAFELAWILNCAGAWSGEC